MYNKKEIEELVQECEENDCKDCNFKTRCQRIDYKVSQNGNLFQLPFSWNEKDIDDILEILNF